MANYRRNMDAWEEQQELQKHLFTITDGGVPNEPSGAVSQKTGRKTDKVMRFADLWYRFV